MVVGLGEGSVRQTKGGGGGGDIHLIRPLDELAIKSWPQNTFYGAGGGGVYEQHKKRECSGTTKRTCRTFSPVEIHDDPDI